MRPWEWMKGAMRSIAASLRSGGGRATASDPLRAAATAPDRPVAVPARGSPPPLPQMQGGQGGDVLVLDKHVAATGGPTLSNTRQLRAAINRLFGASRPVEDRSELCGRDQELDRLFEAVCDTSMHALIYGPRGSGKTSLARVFGDYADERGFHVVYLSCAGSGNFAELMLPYFDDLPAEMFDMREDEYRRAVEAVAAHTSARSLAALFARIHRDRVVLILDEFDRVEDLAAKNELGNLVKLLSDMRVPVRLLFVGIAGNVNDLIGAHPSIRRHLAAVAVGGITDGEVDSFIRKASDLSGIEFTESARRAIVWVVRGSPYHMRLICLHSCFEALHTSGKTVDEHIATLGVRAAADGWAEMNEEAADLFDRLTGSGEVSLPALETFAATATSLVDFDRGDIERAFAADAAQDASVSPEQRAAVVFAALQPALRQLPSAADRYTFDDPLAPQFLIAACMLARQNRRPLKSGLATGEMQ